MTTFDDLVFEPHPVMNGVQAAADFDNGYGAVVSRANVPFGDDDGPYELVVTRHGTVCSDSGITEGVEVLLTATNVTSLLGRIAALPKAKPEDGGA